MLCWQIAGAYYDNHTKHTNAKLCDFRLPPPLKSCISGFVTQRMVIKYLSVPSPKVSQSKTLGPLKMGAICSPETSVSNHVTLRNNPEDARLQNAKFF